MIRNRDAIATDERRAVACDCLAAGIDGAAPGAAVRDALAIDGDRLAVRDESVSLDAVDRVLVLGGGKPAGELAAALESVLAEGPVPADGLVVCDHAVDTDRIPVSEASHPLPDERGLAATRTLLDRARSAGDGTLVLATIGGGGSALLPAPAGDLSLDALREVTRSVLDAGASIDELNAVRKHCSAIKGGQLARAAAPARVIGLLCSDVVGDDPAVIASGPTAPDPTTYADAIAVLDRYGVAAPAVRAHLERGAAGAHPETPAAGDPAVDRVTNHVILNGRRALAAAANAARDAGYAPHVLASRVRGEARESGRTHAAIASEVATAGDPVDPPAVLLSGGECTVTVTGEGRGGPNAEFALAAGLDLDADGVDAVAAAVDTDGRDGGTDAAGGLVGREAIDDRDAARAALDDNDAAGFLGPRAGQIETGPTGTNVNDLRVLVVDG